MANAALDNDVLLKSACYGFFRELVESVPGAPHSPGILGTAKFVLPRALRKRPPTSLDNAQAELQKLLDELETLEPTVDEVAIAAELEHHAQTLELPMHVGECQLIAIVLARGLRFLLTGDRSALQAAATLNRAAAFDLEPLNGKLICFEQAVYFLAKSQGASWVRDLVCTEVGVDTALRLCFSCSSSDVPEQSWLEGLESYVSALRETTGALLWA